jgi:hypothetical protein
LTRITLLLTAAAALLVAVLLSGCDLFGGDGDEDPDQVLEETFENDETVSSGVLDVTIEGSAEGEQGGSFSANLNGAFQGEEGEAATLPQLDLTASADAEGAGQEFSFEGGVVATEDNGYVEYQGETYEVGTDTFEQLKRSFEQQAEAAGATGEDAEDPGAALEQLGVDPSGWLTNLENEGTEDIEGTEAIHIHGDANVEQIIEDFTTLAEQAPTGTADIPSAEELQQVTAAVDEASIDVYSGESDRLLRGLDLNLSIDPSAVAAGAVVPIESVDLGFSLRLSGVNEPQTIEAPAEARPIEDLLRQFGLGGLPLGDLGGAGIGGAGGGLYDFDGPGGVSPGGGEVSPGGSQDAYLDCIADAQTNEEIAACAEEL